MSTFGSRLKSEREKHGWSQIFVGKKLGIPNTTISGYERDFRKPEFDTLIKLANLYEVSIDYLVSGVSNELTDVVYREITEDQNRYLDSLIAYIMQQLVDKNGKFYNIVIPHLEKELAYLVPNASQSIEPDYLMRLVSSSSSINLKNSVSKILFEARKKAFYRIDQYIEDLLATGVTFDVLEKWLDMLLEIRTSGGDPNAQH